MTKKSIAMVYDFMPIYDIQNETLQYKIQPLEFYDGVILSSYPENQTEINPGEYVSTRLILEYMVIAAENSDWWHMLPPGECRKNAQVMWQSEGYQQVDGVWELSFETIGIGPLNIIHPNSEGKILSSGYLTEEGKDVGLLLWLNKM